jgi:divalent metal cation (Fe/Co/Zn/Cd) transporter
MLILQQGISILSGTVKELTDASVPPATTALLSKALTPLLSSSSSSSSHDSTTGDDIPSIRAITDLRARRAGARTFVELTAQVDGRLHVGQTAALERRIVEVLRKARGEVDVLVRFVPDEKR